LNAKRGHRFSLIRDFFLKLLLYREGGGGQTQRRKLLGGHGRIRHWQYRTVENMNRIKNIPSSAEHSANFTQARKLLSFIYIDGISA